MTLNLPIVDLQSLPVLWQVEAVKGIEAWHYRPPLAIAAHPVALSLVFKDSTEAFCRGFDLLPRSGVAVVLAEVPK